MGIDNYEQNAADRYFADVVVGLNLSYKVRHN